MMIISQDIVNNYEYFYSRISGNLDYQFNPNQKQVVMIDNFLKLLDKKYNLNTLGSSFLFDYFSFQFSIKYDRKTRFGKGVIYLNHVIGQKSLEDWENKDNEHWTYFRDQFLNNFNIPLAIEKIDKKLLKSLEEIERNRFVNTLEGFVHCLTNDLKFDQYSRVCLFCNYKLNCKKL